MRNPSRALIVPAVAALLVAGCGSDSGSSDTTAPTTTVVETTTATSTAAATSASTASTAAPSAATTPPTIAPATDTPVAGDALEIIIDVDDPAQVGQTWPVPLGQTVILRLLSDTDQEYHVHGYELEQRVAAGVEASFEFAATEPGTFEVETHTTDMVLATLQVG